MMKNYGQGYKGKFKVPGERKQQRLNRDQGGGLSKMPKAMNDPWRNSTVLA